VQDYPVTITEVVRILDSVRYGFDVGDGPNIISTLSTLEV